MYYYQPLGRACQFLTFQARRTSLFCASPSIVCREVQRTSPAPSKPVSSVLVVVGRITLFGCASPGHGLDTSRSNRNMPASQPIANDYSYGVSFYWIIVQRRSSSYSLKRSPSQNLVRIDRRLYPSRGSVVKDRVPREDSPHGSLWNFVSTARWSQSAQFLRRSAPTFPRPGLLAYVRGSWCRSMATSPPPWQSKK